MPFIEQKPLTSEKIPCTSPEHNPPMSLYQEPGTYTWQCPICGKTITYTIHPITC